MEQKKFDRVRKEARVAAGKCMVCGKAPSVLGHKLCNRCLQKKAARTKEIYYERKAKGLCVRCGKPAVPGKVKCAECAKKQW